MFDLWLRLIYRPDTFWVWCNLMVVTGIVFFRTVINRNLKTQFIDTTMYSYLFRGSEVGMNVWMSERMYARTRNLQFRGVLRKRRTSHSCHWQIMIMFFIFISYQNVWCIYQNFIICICSVLRLSALYSIVLCWEFLQLVTFFCVLFSFQIVLCSSNWANDWLVKTEDISLSFSRLLSFATTQSPLQTILETG